MKLIFIKILFFFLVWMRFCVAELEWTYFSVITKIFNEKHLPRVEFIFIEI